jgi:F-type H+-transporting ATPase subunit b
MKHERLLLTGLVAFCLVAFACAANVRADEPEGSHGQAAATNAHHDEAAKDEGLFGYALDLGVWTVVVFLTLLFVLKRHAWGPMLDGLQKREDSIRSALDEAQRAREEAKTLQARFEAEMNRAQEKVREVMDEARRDAQAMRDDMVAKAKSEIQTERERMRHDIEMARDAALHQLWNQSAQLATMIASKAIRRQLNIDDQRQLIDEAITEMQGARPTTKEYQ